MATREVVTPLVNGHIMLGTSVWLFRYLEKRDLSINKKYRKTFIEENVKYLLGLLIKSKGATTYAHTQ